MWVSLGAASCHDGRPSNTDVPYMRCAPLCRPEIERGAIKLPRRRFLHQAAGAAALLAFSSIARAQTYPSRPVHLIVGFPPGGAADITARLMGQWLSERLGQPFVIENRPGAGTNIGTEAVARAPADGYTLLLVSVANTVNATLYERLNFNFIRDIAPVAGLIRGPLVMEIHPSVPANTIQSISTCSTYHTEAVLPPSSICLRGRCRSSSITCRPPSNTSEPASCDR